MAFLKSIKEEFKIIKFPSKNELIKTLKAVILFSAMYLILVSSLDYLFQLIITKIL